jgi:hypothetical protein
MLVSPPPRGLLSGPLQKTVLLIGLAALVYAVPYAVPVKPSVSVSYVVNFSNRTAVFLFLGGTLLFSAITTGELSRIEADDSRLSIKHLFLAEAFATIAFALRLWGGRLGFEAQYEMHRLQMMAAGRHLYTQTDYLYGPLLIMPGLWLARLFHLSMVTAYTAFYFALLLTGFLMVWFVVGNLSLPLRYRAGLFWAVAAIEATGMIEYGTHYTQVWRYTAAVAACMLFTVSTRTKNRWKIATAAIAGTVACLLVSPEQAVGFTVGAAAWLVLCLWRGREGFSIWATAAFAAGAALAFTVAARYSMFREMMAFASGGNAFPLLPSAETILILFIYAAGIAIGWRTFAAGREADENTALLCLVGIAMLPAAMGRCDLGHLCSAVPLLLVGSASLLMMPALRWWFTAAALIVFVLPIHFKYFLRPIAGGIKYRYQHGRPVGTQPEISFSALPCDRSYYAPDLVLRPDAPYKLECVDLGYKRGLSDTYTADEIRAQITEVAERSGKPLLLRNRPLDEIFGPHEYDPSVLIRLEGRPLFMPRYRNSPLSFQPIGEYIVAHYKPGPIILNGQLRIWYPKKRSPSCNYGVH